MEPPDQRLPNELSAFWADAVVCPAAWPFGVTWLHEPVHTAAGRGQNLCVDHPWHAVDAANHRYLSWMGFASPWGSSTNGRLLAAVVAFVINYACYFSEIYRGGIESVPVGQTEAGQVLGMTKSQIFFRVTLLQVIKRILAPMGNEVMTLIKDTSLANVIANKEIIMMAKEYSAKGLIWPLFSTALFFLVFVGAMTLLFNWLEKKLSYFR